MTIILMLLMAYSLVYGSNPTVGEAVHEWLGVGLFVLFVLNHILNRKWSGMMGMARKFKKKPSKLRKWTLRSLAALIAVYGACAFVTRDFGNYMILRYHFVFIDFEESLARFLLDYIAIMGLFVCGGYYSTVILRKNIRNQHIR